MNMKKWLDDMIASPVKKAMPILSFPAIQLMRITVKDLIGDSVTQATAMAAVAQRVDSAAALGPMDLSVEAECFGSAIRFAEDEVPTVIGSTVSCKEEAERLGVPKVGAGRTQIYVDAIQKACRMIQGRPVLAGAIGPFSLAGRLMDVTEILYACYDMPKTVHMVLEKATSFIISYVQALAAAGANGVVIAEPLAGLLSPALSAAFSAGYVRRIVEAVQTESFAVVYHNCGNGTPAMVDEILSTGSMAYHFGNAVNMAEMLEKMPGHVVCMGNIDPAGQFKNGTAASVREATLALLNSCAKYPNFVISSGCDIPPLAMWENIDAFFQAVSDFYTGGHGIALPDDFSRYGQSAFA